MRKNIFEVASASRDLLQELRRIRVLFEERTVIDGGFDGYFSILDYVRAKPEVTAVAEIVDGDTAHRVLRYNHHLMRGNLQAKKDILLALGADVEAKRKKLHAIDSVLEDNIFYILNNLNLRHNNVTEGDRRYKVAVAKMDKQTLEMWYDELYQMLLLAYLQLDQVDRTTRVKELRDVVEGAKA